MVDQHKSPCISEVLDKVIAVKENGKSFRILNGKRMKISKYIIDGCIIKGTEERCDYAFKVHDLDRVIFLELKGCDIKKAVSQLSNTIKIAGHLIEGKRSCHIVSSRCPILAPELQVLKKSFYAKHQSPLHIHKFTFELELT
jgi:hypothetical protein